MTYRGFITRAEWEARSPRSRSNNISAIGQLTHWMGGRVGDISHGRCFDYVRSIQNYHMNTKGWVDVAYTLMPCRHGYIFAGRGKGVRTAANGTNTANYRYYANALLIGQGDTSTQDLVDAHWAGYEMLGSGEHKGHRDFRSTSCPGDWAYDMARRGPQGPIVTDPTSPEEDEMLKQGDGGNAVIVFQKALLAWRDDALPKFGADGDFGDETVEWVKKYQKAANLPETGSIGGVTAALLGRYVSKSGGGGSAPHNHGVYANPKLVVNGTTALGKELAKNLRVDGRLHTREGG